MLGQHQQRHSPPFHRQRPALDTDGASSVDRKAYRIYGDRLRLAAQLASLPADTRPGLPTVSQYDALLGRPVAS